MMNLDEMIIGLTIIAVGFGTSLIWTWNDPSLTVPIQFAPAVMATFVGGYMVRGLVGSPFKET